MGSDSMIPRGRFSSAPIRSIRTRFAYRFLRALKKLNRRTTTSTASKEMMSRRYHMVKTAAYASMASAVGSKRAWSRAMLWKIRKRNNLGGGVMKRSKTRALIILKKRSRIRRSVDNNREDQENPAGISKEIGFEELRKLVPGGEAMDLCKLLDETAHYTKCLTSQVQVMRNILDFYSG